MRRRLPLALLHETRTFMRRRVVLVHVHVHVPRKPHTSLIGVMCVTRMRLWQGVGCHVNFVSAVTAARTHDHEDAGITCVCEAGEYKSKGQDV